MARISRSLVARIGACLAVTPALVGAAGRAAPDVDRDAELSFGITFGYSSFDPHTSPAPGSDAVYQSPVYDQLIALGLDDDGNVTLVPQLAESYEVSEDGMAITFALRHDVTFQDGNPFDAEAVKANIERVRGESSSVSSLLSSVESVEVADEHTAVFHLTQADPSVPWALATDTTGYMVSPAAFDTDLATHPVGTGPFTLVSSTNGQRGGVRAVGRPLGRRRRPRRPADDQCDAGRQRPVQRLADRRPRCPYLATPLDVESQALEAEGYHWHRWLSPTTIGLLMNTDLPPFDDSRVRRAVSMAIDRTELSETLFHGISPPVYQVFVPGIDGFNAAVDVDPFDPDAARALVEEAGADGAQVTILQTTSEPNSSLALVTQEALTNIGLDVELLPLSPSEARGAWREGGYQASAGPITGRFTPSQTIAYGYVEGPDNPATPIPELVEMSDAALALPSDSAEQVAAYEEIAAYLTENPVHVPYVQFATVIVARPEVVGSENLATATIADLDFRNVGKASP